MKVEILIAAIEVLLCVSEINCHGNELGEEEEYDFDSQFNRHSGEEKSGSNSHKEPNKDKYHYDEDLEQEINTRHQQKASIDAKTKKYSNEDGTANRRNVETRSLKHRRKGGCESIWDCDETDQGCADGRCIPQIILEPSNKTILAFGKKERRNYKPGPSVKSQNDNEIKEYDIEKAKIHKENYGGTENFGSGDNDGRDDGEEDRNVDSDDNELISSSTLHELNDNDDDDIDDWYESNFDSDSSLGRSGPIADNHDTN